MNGQGIRWIVIAAAGVMLCAACSDSRNAQRNATAPGASVAASASEPSQSPPPSSVQTPPPLPQEKPSSGDTAQAQDDAVRPMTKDEEATNMPRPSQANDHSTLSPPKDENEKR
jgi:hypothetical protein